MLPQQYIAISQLGGEVIAVEEVESFTKDGENATAVIIRKVEPTPAKFPRRAGMPNKRPL